MLKRAVGYHAPLLELFWSFRKWHAGDLAVGKSIVANIAMFLPFGFLVPAVLSRFGWKVRFFAVVLSAVLFSLSIETLQLLSMRGIFEWDDLISNTLGAVIGVSLYMLFEKISCIRFETATRCICALFAAICLPVCFIAPGFIGGGTDVSSRAYCFQVDDAAVSDGVLTLTGFSFRYEHPKEKISLSLRSPNGNRIKLETDCGIERPDVNDYFRCEYDYTHVGFVAKGTVDRDTEYEIMIKWPWFAAIPTGVFVSSAGVHYFPDNAFKAPSVTADFIEFGIPRVYHPDFHVWVYQHEGALYWVADQGFFFEEDGSTFIPFQLYTTQIENLPEKMLADGKHWDYLGGSFERCELEGDWGRYRIMKQELPVSYSITSIVTGHYKGNRWIWEACFRPFYKF